MDLAQKIVNGTSPAKPSWYKMHIREDCIHFSWKKILFIGSMNKVDQCFLLKPMCKAGKLTRFGNCPKDCRWFEARKDK